MYHYLCPENGALHRHVDMIKQARGPSRYTVSKMPLVLRTHPSEITWTRGLTSVRNSGMAISQAALSVNDQPMAGFDHRFN
jgi:hypothetical protein